MIFGRMLLQYYQQERMQKHVIQVGSLAKKARSNSDKISSYCFCYTKLASSNASPRNLSKWSSVITHDDASPNADATTDTCHTSSSTHSQSTPVLVCFLSRSGPTEVVPQCLAIRFLDRSVSYWGSLDTHQFWYFSPSESKQASTRRGTKTRQSTNNHGFFAFSLLQSPFPLSVASFDTSTAATTSNITTTTSLHVRCR